MFRNNYMKTKATEWSLLYYSTKKQKTTLILVSFITEWRELVNSVIFLNR